MDVRLNIKAIIRWEQLTGKAFHEMDYSNMEDVQILMYATYVCANNLPYTYAVFKNTLSNKKEIGKIAGSLQKQTEVLSQFSKREEGSIDADEAEIKEYSKISDIVSFLIVNGLDAHYALEEMEICDIPLYVEAYNKKRREELLNDRLWTYIGMIPHLSKKISERDIYIFPWEVEDEKRRAEEEMKANEANLERFLSGEMFDFSKVQWSKKEN